MSEQRSRLVIEINTANAERNARNVARELQNIERNGDFTSRSMDSLSSATRSLAGHMAGLLTIGTAISKMDAYTGLQNRLKLVTNSQSELNTAMGDTFAIAQKTASSWDSTAMVYQRFADNADRLGISLKQTAGLTETVSKAIAVSGGSAASAEAALMQFGQALASGVLRGEEFNSIAEQAPGLLKAIAFGLDTNVGSLRAMAANGEITGDALVEALSKAKPYIDELFNKTDFTISQSFTKLSNEVTKFVGEAGKGSGAASALSGAIDVLASNLDTIANIAVVGGVALLTKAILTQTVAVHGSIASTIQRRAADTALLQSQIQLAALEVQRTRQVTALALTEINLARSELNSATTRQARAVATMRLTQAEIALSIAQKQGIASTVAQTAAENALNVARSRSAMLMGLVGGPIGVITIGVTALAAGYMYMSSRADEANKKLEEQAAVANRTAKELQALKGLERDNATNDMAAAFERQNKALSESSSQINMQLTAIKRLYAGNKKVVQVVDDAQKGTISMSDALKKFNELRINPEIYNSLKKNSDEFVSNAKEATNTRDKLKILGFEFELTGRKAQVSANGTDIDTAAKKRNAQATNEASEAQSKYLNQLQKSNVEVMMTNKLMDAGWSPERAKAAAKLRSETGNVTKEGLLLIDQNIAANKKLQASEDALKRSKKSLSSASKSAASQSRRDAKDLENRLKEQASMREQIAYKNADRLKKIELDLAREIADIQKANFNGVDTANLIEVARNRADIEKKIFIAQSEFEINQHRYNEEQKLKKTFEINQLILQANMENDDQLFNAYADSLDERYKEELAQIKLTQETRLFQMREAFMSETDVMNERYRLEREQILLNSKISLEQKQIEIALSKANQQEESRQRFNNATQQWGQTQADMNGSGDQFRLEQERFGRYEQSQVLFEAEMALAEGNYALMEQAYANHKGRMKQIDDNYQSASISLQMAYGESITGSLASIFKDMSGEQSAGYRAMFAISKGFAVANAAVALVENISNASKIGFPYNLPMIAGAVAQGASIVSMLSGVQEPQGFKSGGYTGNVGVNQEAGVVHGQEYVLNAEATKRVGVSTLNAINNGGTIQADRMAQASSNQGNLSEQQPITIINQLEQDSLVGSYMRGAAGGRILMNFIKENPSDVRAALGV